MSVLKILKIRKDLKMIYIKKAAALLLCFFCLTGCFRGASEVTEGTESAVESTAALKQTESTEAEKITEGETETAADTTEDVTESESVTESEEITEAETVPESVTEAETEPPADNGSAPVPVPGEITYINGILVVNKTYPLPADYNPGVDKTAQDALWVMISAAAEEGLSLWARSGFRSYNDQLWQYNVYAERDGAAVADTYSARPGHSEHQSGLAFDMNSLDRAFANTAEGQWLAANSYKYGFIIRYPAGKEHITGYMYEPWHVRYVGVELATEIHALGVCLEEYLGITSEYASSTTSEPVI